MLFKLLSYLFILLNVIFACAMENTRIVPIQKPLSTLYIIDNTRTTGENAVTIEHKAEMSYWGPMIYDCPIKDTVNIPLFKGDIVRVSGPGGVPLLKYTPTGKFSHINLIIGKSKKSTKVIRTENPAQV